ncbi:MAG: pilus assembly protein CpaE [Moorella sp. (in: firmicutes)]|nr:pilus assembly protein CpaE [Moorella sp. (in: firmicutes)]
MGLSRKIIIVWSPRSCGATAVATSLAWYLSRKEKNNRVALLDLNINTPDIRTYFKIKESPTTGLDRVLPMLKSGQLKEADLLGRMVKNGPLFILAGTMELERTISFEDREMDLLLGVTQALFNIVVVDVPPGLDNMVTLYAISRGEEVWCIVDQNVAKLDYLLRWLQVLPEGTIFREGHMRLIVNSYRPDDGPSWQQVARALDWPVAGTLPYVPRAHDCLLSGQPLMVEDGHFAAALTRNVEGLETNAAGLWANGLLRLKKLIGRREKAHEAGDHSSQAL